MTTRELLCQLLAGGALTVACGTAPSTDLGTEPLAVELRPIPPIVPSKARDSY